ncbi:hypothetical protein [Hydrocarboniclastica marina]|uniref:Secreted protein n=1 Tax=Hydrocarboniclastica marina TaxID=2259620 RepID=A0A4P7XK65_9ALTE|nr:hypothetical protein [Hydrocarboniclastica marina]MAM00258.1 hypothetical protein [Alteromonadaceae bacterium]QCF27586.1 hypothetical protein soil367_17585 [Hydrocarboniclastica marina]
MKELKARLITPLLIASLSLSGALLAGCGDEQAGGDEGFDADEVPAAPRGDPSSASPADSEEEEPDSPSLLDETQGQ